MYEQTAARRKKLTTYTKKRGNQIKEKILIQFLLLYSILQIKSNHFHQRSMTRTVIESGKIIDTAEKGDGDDV